MKVEEFGFGFPPRLFSWVKNGVRYSLNLIPFGGFVKILGEDGADRMEQGSFAAQPAKWRFGVLAAGVVMNLLFAAVLMMLSNGLGVRSAIDAGTQEGDVSDRKVQILEVAPDSPAFKSGFVQFDEVISVKSPINEFKIGDSAQFQQVIFDHPGVNLDVSIIRDGESKVVSVVPQMDQSGKGKIGVSILTSGKITYPWYEAIWRGLYDTYRITIVTIQGYWDLIVSAFTKDKVVGEVSGPIGIATLTGKAARMGFDFLIQFVAIISINLAILNSIPFPALDGGRILFLVIEKIKGSPMSKKVEGGLNAAGFSLLFILMIYVTVKDIIKLF